MDIKDIFKERIKLYNNIDNEENHFLNERIQTKLNLRKQKFNEILNKKRLSEYISIISKNGNIKWKLLYDINKEQFTMEKKYKFKFSNEEDEEIISLSSEYLKSENILDIKYSIMLLQIFINKHMNEEIKKYINLLFIYDFFGLIEKFSTNKEIIFNILYIILCYSNISTDNNLYMMLLSPNSYKIWEICFNLQNYEILYEIVAILNNIISKNQVGGCNLIRSNFLLNNIYNFYMNQTITSQLNNNNKKDVMYNIIEDGIILFCKLMIVPMDNLDSFTKEEIYISKQKIINVILTYYNSDLYKIYHVCIYCIYIAVQQEKRLFDEIDKINFIENVLKNKKFFEIENIRYFINNIIGNYVAYKNKINYSLLVDIINFEKEYIKKCNISYYKKEIFWVLSNIIICDKNIINKILENNEFLEEIIFCYKNTCSYPEIKEISYFFGNLLINANFKQFIQVEKYKLMEIVIEHIKKNLENDVEGLSIIFELLEFYLSLGKIMEKYFNGKNIILEKFNKLGGKELLDKYILIDNKSLNDQIYYILKNYY